MFTRQERVENAARMKAISASWKSAARVMLTHPDEGLFQAVLDEIGAGGTRLEEEEAALRQLVKDLFD